MQGDFLAEVFGNALGYAGPTDGGELWHRQQHHSIAGETPDAILGFRPPNPIASTPRPTITGTANPCAFANHQTTT